MKRIQVIFVTIVISATVVHARNYEQPVNEENLEFGQAQSVDVNRPHHNSEPSKHTRHRRKRQYGSWNNYIQDYNQPWRPNYDTCPEREILSQMMKIMTLMMQKENARTPNVYVSCGKPNSQVNPSVDNRVPDLEDPHMNWGVYRDENDNKKVIDHDQFTKRPLNLEPYRPQNDGAHDTNDFTTKSPPIISVPRNIIEEKTPERYPNVCDFAYVACCDKVNHRTRQECFINLGCHNVPNGKPCDSKTQQDAFNFIAETYKLNQLDE